LESIRVSVGTAATLGILEYRVDAIPTTAYLMTHTSERCTANCAFCAQARTSQAPADRLSLVTWPIFPFSKILSKFSEKRQNLPFKRICIQTIIYPHLKDDLIFIISRIRKSVPQLPISVALPPVSEAFLSKLKDMKVNRVGISLDAVTPKLFNAIKGSKVNGPFTWKNHLHALESAITIFGSNQTTTHIMVGLGEKEDDVIKCIQQLTDKGITIGLFPFTPLPGTLLAQHARPSLAQYRRLQLAHYLIKHNIVRAEQMTFSSSERKLIDFGLTPDILKKVILNGEAFQTTGCPSCNRPFYTERPSGPLYNFPFLPSANQLIEIQQQIRGEL
jgi:biotin synthase-related radical SAM superfamily protein